MARHPFHIQDVFTSTECRVNREGVASEQPASKQRAF